MPRHARRRVLRGIADGIRAQREDLARTIALEAGKPIAQARVEVDRGVVTFDLAAEEATRLGGEVLPIDLEPRAEGYVATVHRVPLGLVAGISPFNFPLNLVAHKAAPALAAGNALVLKPARKTPLTALRLARLALEAGAPAGAFNVVNCDRETGDRLVTDGRFRMLTFTGSAAVGWPMKARAGKKKVVLELGGNAAVIVESDADLDWTVERCVAGGFSYAGQSCISVQRIYVQEKVYDPFVERLLARVARLRIGDPLDEATEVGPVIDEENARRVVSWIDEARVRGARVLAGGGRKGTLVEPAVVEEPPRDAAITCEEAFGPVVTLHRYRAFEDALAAVNDSVYGLQAGLFTHDLRKVHRAFEAIEVGALVVGEVPTFRVDNYPYGGVKDSGFGREGVRYAIEEMTEPRVLVVNTRK
jgi:glyceraldehyde-3-phosphate dehydrogenase (NADP+)